MHTSVHICSCASGVVYLHDCMHVNTSIFCVSVLISLCHHIHLLCILQTKQCIEKCIKLYKIIKGIMWLNFCQMATHYVSVCVLFSQNGWQGRCGLHEVFARQTNLGHPENTQNCGTWSVFVLVGWLVVFSLPEICSYSFCIVFILCLKWGMGGEGFKSVVLLTGELL